MSALQRNQNNAIIFVEDAYYHRWLDAWGENVRKFILQNPEPVDDTTGDPTRFVMTVVEAGDGDTTCVNSQTAGSSLLITTAANEYDGINLQARGEAFKLESAKPLYFGIKATVSQATLCDVLMGLCELDTALMAVETAHAIAIGGDGVFFSKLSAVTTVIAKSILDGAETASVNAPSALTTSASVYEMYWDGTTLYFYVDNVLVTSIASGLPDGDLTFSVNFRAGSAAARTLTIDWARVIQCR